MVVMNSEAYWSRRFQTDWVEQGGREQSRAFYRMALREMPDWLTTAIKRDRLTVCDWGCAFGDGTDILCHALDTGVTGIDFSEVAITHARERYSKPRFLTADLLTESLSEMWDVVFSSNTLEHFAEPWSVLRRLRKFAKSALVILVPYREFDRYAEHEYTFLNTNIPVGIGAFELRHVAVINAALEPASLWSGHQILLVYTSRKFREELKLSLTDLRVEEDWTSQELQRLRLAAEEQSLQVTGLKKTLIETEHELTVIRQQCAAAVSRELDSRLALESHEGQISTLQGALEDRDGQIASLREALQVSDMQRTDWELKATAMEQSTSWKITEPLRIIKGTVQLLRDRRHTSRQRFSFLRELKHSSGTRVAVDWLFRRLMYARPEADRDRPGPGSVSNFLPEHFNPYDLIEPLAPIEVEVTDREFKDVQHPFTCVATVRNEGKSISRFLQSIATQTALPRELVIVDGGSTDDTLERLHDFSKAAAFPVRVIAAGDVNISRGRNIGCENVDTGIIVFLDAGCELDSTFLGNIVGPYADDCVPDLVAGIYVARRDSPYAREFIYDWENPHISWAKFLPSARALSVRTALFHDVGGFPEYLTRTGEDTWFDITYRRVSQRWVINKSARVIWDAPTASEERDRLAYNYAYGDGESGFGDFRYYPTVTRSASSAPNDPSVKGYLAGRKRRSEIEVLRRKISGVVLILSGVPFTDSGGGQRCSQLAIAFTAQNYKVFFINIYPSFEEKKILYSDVDYSLFEFYSLQDFSLSEFVARYGPFLKTNILVIIEFPHPKLLPLINDLKSYLEDKIIVCYDLIDNWKTSLGWDWYSETTEEAIIEKSDLLLASAATLQKSLEAKTGRPVALIPNAVNDILFDPTLNYPKPNDLVSGKKIITYIGALWGEWFDWDLLSYASDMLEDCDFVLIGGASRDKIRSFSRRHKNVTWLGLKQQRDLPAYLAHTDVAILPFTVDQITRYVNPLKVYEYLSMRVPVVATNLAEITGWPSVTLTRTREEFVEAIHRESRSTISVTAIDAFIESNNWRSRVTAIRHLLPSQP